MSDREAAAPRARPAGRRRVRHRSRRCRDHRRPSLGRRGRGASGPRRPPRTDRHGGTWTIGAGLTRGRDARRSVRAWRDFRVIEVSPAFVEHTGVPHAVVRTATEIFGTPDPRSAERYGRVAETGESMRFEEPERALGRVPDLNAFRRGGDARRGVAVPFNDVSRRRRAADALR